MNDFFKYYVVLYKNEIMILKPNLFGSQVMKKDGSVHMTCEIAPISEFIIIGEF